MLRLAAWQCLISYQLNTVLERGMTVENGSEPKSPSPLIAGLVLARSGCGSHVRVCQPRVAHSLWPPLWCAHQREETPLHTGTAGSSHSLFFSQCSHQLPYLMDLGSEWVFCPGGALQCSELEFGILLWGKLFLPCTLHPFPHFFRLCQFKKRNSSSYLEGIAEVDFRESAISFFHFVVCEVSWDNTENHGVGGVAFENHWTFNKIPSGVQDQRNTAQALSCCTCAHT